LTTASPGRGSPMAAAARSRARSSRATASRWSTAWFPTEAARMKKLAPLLIALLGLGVGVGVGLALKPAPEPEVAAACPPAEGEAEAKAEVACPADGADPFAPTKPEEKKKKAAE